MTSTEAPHPAPHLVLVVEDDAGWQSIYQEIFSDVGHRVILATSYGEGRACLQNQEVDLALVDLHLISSSPREDNRDGLRLLRVARERAVPSIVVSALGDPSDIDQAYDEFGIFAFIEKEAFDRRRFVRMVQQALSAQRPARPAPPASLLDPLSDREREVLALLVKGYANRQIAEALVITPNTVKKHVDHIFQKLGVNSRAAAVAAALSSGAFSGSSSPGD